LRRAVRPWQKGDNPMTYAHSMRFPRRVLFSMMLWLVPASAGRADPPAAPAPAPPPRLRIKNAQSITVTLGTRRHEPASAIRPEKGVWNVVTMSDLSGASAELLDLTPNAPRSRWLVDVQAEKVVLDERRFLPTHVYQLDVRKQKKLIGTALVYLYPPPTEKVGHVEFKDEESAKKDDSSGLSAVPKGDL
jgi:hypothetical protein